MKKISPDKLVDPRLLAKEDIETLLPILDDLQQWASQVQKYALKQAINGTKYKGFKVVRSRIIRKFYNPDKALAVLIKAGYEEAMFFERRMLTVPTIEKQIGKSSFKKLLANEIKQAQGKPALVVESDPRPDFKPGNRGDAAPDFRD